MCFILFIVDALFNSLFCLNIINSAMYLVNGATDEFSLLLPIAKFVSPTFSFAVKPLNCCPLHHTCNPFMPHCGTPVAVIAIHLVSNVRSAFV